MAGDARDVCQEWQKKEMLKWTHRIKGKPKKRWMDDVSENYGNVKLYKKISSGADK